MKLPVLASRKPYFQTLKKGRTYLWCSCGLSRRQPYCDGSHRGTGFEPISYTAQVDEEVLFCGCKQTGDRPFCDGSHTNLQGGYHEDDPASEVNCRIPFTEHFLGPRAMLDGGCYVFRTAMAPLLTKGNIRHCTVISEALGACHQSQFYVELDQGLSPVMAFGQRHVVLFISGGEGSVVIGGRRFEAHRSDGVYVRPGEAFALEADRSIRLCVFISVCPAVAELQWLDQMPLSFDDSRPDRIVRVDENKRRQMASRYFQMLVDRCVGSTVATQFIGHIPVSKAEPHRHLYEEALIILRGQGCMWTESKKTPVTSGDVVFLPRKQLHSLQSVAAGGLDVVGVIYPGNNPSISY